MVCIGDSITEGSGIADPQENSYPALLQKLLGQGYEVHNFGIAARTMLKSADRPYMAEEKYRQALAMNPDMVIIKLGTNDTKPHNWTGKAAYKQDMEAMLNDFLAAEPSPRIYLALPAPAMGNEWGINDSILINEVVPAVREVADAYRLTLIDLRTPLMDHPGYFPDNIHPNEEGAKILAAEVYKALTGDE